MNKSRRCAPILIPTLCRYDHLKQCIESLRKNSWAQFTTIYISVDYPPKQEYFMGYYKIKEYVLNEIEGFYKVNYFFQSVNLGAYENERFLVNEALKKYDSYIFTEDDNVFAPSAIQFFNKGLEQFKEDKNIIAICAHGKKSNMDGSQGIYKMSCFSGYGFATWKHKQQIYMERMNRDYFQSIASNNNMFKTIYDQNIIYLQALLNIIYKKEDIYIYKNNMIAAHDLPISLYMLCEEKYAVYPRCLLARNYGYDGTGINCKRKNIEHVTRIDDRRDYFFEQSELEIEKIEKKEKWFYFIYRMIYLAEIIIFRVRLKKKKVVKGGISNEGTKRVN